MPTIFFPRRLLAGPALGLLALLTACVSELPQTVSVEGQPVQSPNDERAYRMLTLDNGMQVLLVSDPDTQKAAAALDVYVGSGDNPSGRGGLAHFLEHMLFLGTDKYPDPAEYEEFVTEHGGNRNAYTSFEHTNYFFDIDQQYLPEGLDRFAQFFIAPKFDAGYVDREKNAVQAEYQMGLKSDPRRGLDVFQELISPDHPFSQFAVGSLESLGDRPDSLVRDELLDFYATYYSANNMRLAVYGSQSLSELETLVRPIFEQVPNHDFEHTEIAPSLFTQGDLPLLVKIRPQATQRALDLAFPMPEYRLEYRSKPMSYLSNLFGHEGEGSLLSQLKAEGLAEGIAASPGIAWRGGSLFSVRIALSEKGSVQYDRVIQLFFAYADVIRRAGPQPWLYSEQGQQADLAFRFSEEGNPMGYVTSLAGTMHYYEPEDTLRGSYMMQDYRPDLLAQAMERVRPENALVELIDSGVETDRLSKHYQVPYSRQPVSPEQLARWSAPVSGVSLALPEPNSFIATDLNLRDLSGDDAGAPEQVLTDDRQVVWFRQARDFRVPRGATYINFKTPAVGQSPAQTAAAMLYVALMKDALNEFTYPALLAGLNFDLYKHAQGVSLRISGYNDKQLALLEKILATLRRGEFNDRRFEDIRTDLVRGLQNIEAMRPSSQVMRRLRESLLHGEWSEQLLIAQLIALTPSGVADYAAAFWRDARADVLVYGNYSSSQPEKVARQVGKMLEDGMSPALAPLRVTRVKAGDDLQLQADVAHDDAVVAWYLQGADDGWNDRAMAALTGQIMKSGFFQQLRTEQQLGYVVSAFAYPQLEVPGLAMVIQSPSNSAVEVQEAMAAFMDRIEGDIDAQQFRRHKMALLGEISEPDKNLLERAEFYWQSIARDQFDFDGRQRMEAAVDAIDLSDWLAYFKATFLEQPHSLMVVAPGRWAELPAAAKRFDNPEALKAGQPWYDAR